MGLTVWTLDPHEDLIQAVWRETLEETTLRQDDFEPYPPYQLRTLVIPTAEKTAIGIIYILRLKNELPRAGIVVPGREIDLVKPFSQAELIKLESQPTLVHKPEFNLPAFSEVQSWWNEF